ncbi:DUF4785 domain-containing protein [Thalassotalea fusca]
MNKLFNTKPRVFAITLVAMVPLMLKANNSTLHTLPAPEQHIDKTTVHFSSPIKQALLANKNLLAYRDVSDEYWFEVTGEELTKGVPINISAQNALIRISGKKQPFHVSTQNISPEWVELLHHGKVVNSPFKSTVTAEQLATANMFPNSSALTLSDQLPMGLYQLAVNQPLPKDERFIINVKEKQSPYKAVMEIEKQSFVEGDSIPFQMSLSNELAQKTSDAERRAKQVRKATVRFPTGETHEVNINYGKQGLYIKVPENIDVEHRPGTLHELHIQTTSHVAGKTIMRNNKIAFAYTRPTAKITATPTVKSEGATFSIDVASEGRYEISAVVSGNRQGEGNKAVMLSRSAYYLTPGQHELTLVFDKTILSSGNVTPPYQLSNIKLFDQSRLQLINN